MSPPPSATLGDLSEPLLDGRNFVMPVPARPPWVGDSGGLSAMRPQVVIASPEGRARDVDETCEVVRADPCGALLVLLDEGCRGLDFRGGPSRRAIHRGRSVIMEIVHNPLDQRLVAIVGIVVTGR